MKNETCYSHERQVSNNVLYVNKAKQIKLFAFSGHQ